jgi:hypothetical protein
MPTPPLKGKLAPRSAIGDNAFGANEAKKKGPGNAPLGQCKGRCCSEGSVPALLVS